MIAMLVIVTHSHDPDKCPAIGGLREEFLDSLTEEKAREMGVKLLSAYANSLEHTIYLTIEAQNVLEIDRFVGKALRHVGTTRVTPVVSVKETLDYLRKNESVQHRVR